MYDDRQKKFHDRTGDPKPLVYIAAPYSSAPSANTERAMDIWNQLADLGIPAICPHLTHFLHNRHPRPYDDWLDYDFVLLNHCTYLYDPFPDEPSPGRDREVEFFIRKSGREYVINDLDMLVAAVRKDVKEWENMWIDNN